MAEHLAAERKLWLDATRSGLSGPDWDDLLDQMVRYAFPELRSAVRSGWIFRWCPQNLFRPQHWPEHDREEIVQDMIGKALAKFVEAAKLGCGWDPEQDKPLGPYFLNLCILEFSNLFRAQLLQYRRSGAQIDESTNQVIDHREDPARAAAAKITIDAIVNAKNIPIRQRTALIAQGFGLSQAEIAKQMNTSPRAVEGLIQRGRQQARQVEGETA